MFVESNKKLIDITGCSVEIETQVPIMPYDDFPECHNLVAKDRHTGAKQIIAQFENKKEAEAVHAKIRDALKKNENFVNIRDCEPGDQNTAMGEITHLDFKDYDKVRQPLQENEVDVSKSDLPEHELHPVIVQKVWSMFLQGNYGPAVLQAFKEVEIAVREAGNYSESDHGVSLMREAFHKDTGKSDAGKLTDTNQQSAEQEALGHLFAGAMGYCRNPLGHREVNLSAEEAVEMIFFASYLLRIVDSRSQSEGD